jgi:hypothetical protein
MAAWMLTLYGISYFPMPEEAQGSCVEPYPELPAKPREGLRFIQQSLARRHSPSIREVAGVTGFRAATDFVKRGWLERQKNGRLRVLR